jgi:hypothetical protein
VRERRVAVRATVDQDGDFAGFVAKQHEGHPAYDAGERALPSHLVGRTGYKPVMAKSGAVHKGGSKMKPAHERNAEAVDRQLEEA